MGNDEISYKAIYELIDSRLNRFEDHFGSKIEVLEKRTSVLEHWQSGIMGRVAMIGFFIAVVIQISVAVVIDTVRSKIKL